MLYSNKTTLKTHLILQDKKVAVLVEFVEIVDLRNPSHRSHTEGVLWAEDFPPMFEIPKEALILELPNQKESIRIISIQPEYNILENKNWYQISFISEKNYQSEKKIEDRTIIS